MPEKLNEHQIENLIAQRDDCLVRIEELAEREKTIQLSLEQANTELTALTDRYKIEIEALQQENAKLVGLIESMSGTEKGDKAIKKLMKERLERVREEAIRQLEELESENTDREEEDNESKTKSKR